MKREMSDRRAMAYVIRTLGEANIRKIADKINRAQPETESETETETVTVVNSR